MSFFAKLLGVGQSKKKAPSPVEAIQKLKNVEEMLGKKQIYLEQKIDEEMAIAKKLGTRNRKAALQALKRKKRYELQLGQIDGTLTTIEFQKETLENASTNMEVVKILGVASKALKNIHKDMDIEDVNTLIEDIQEQQDIAHEIESVICIPNTTDEDDLLRELELLEQQELKKLPDVGKIAADVPRPEKERRRRSGRSRKEAKELSKLEAWAS